MRSGELEGRHRWLTGAFVIIFCLMGAVVARAELRANLESTVTQADGVFKYTYALKNLKESTIKAGLLNIQIGAGASISAIDTPLGWHEVFDPEESVMSWEVIDIESGVEPGHTEEFKFESSQGPGLNMFGILGFDDTSIEPLVVTGTTTSPSSVPEPASIGGLVTGLSATALRRKR